MGTRGNFHSVQNSGNFGQKPNVTDHFGSVRPEYLGPALKVDHFEAPNHSSWSSGNVLFPFGKIAFSTTFLLHSAYKNNNQMRGGLGRICAARMYRSIGYVEFPKFHTGSFVEWKAPQALDKNLC